MKSGMAVDSKEKLANLQRILIANYVEGVLKRFVPDILDIGVEVNLEEEGNVITITYSNSANCDLPFEEVHKMFQTHKCEHDKDIIRPALIDYYGNQRPMYDLLNLITLYAVNYYHNTCKQCVIAL